MYLHIRIQKKGVKLLLGLSPIMCSKKKKGCNFYRGISGPRVVGKRVEKLESGTKVLESGIIIFIPQKCHKITFRHLIHDEMLNFS